VYNCIIVVVPCYTDSEEKSLQDLAVEKAITLGIGFCRKLPFGICDRNNILFSCTCGMTVYMKTFCNVTDETEAFQLTVLPEWLYFIIFISLNIICLVAWSF